MLTSAFLAACSDGTLRQDTTPQVLLPIEKTNIADGRARFREIYCAIQQDHGRTLLHDRGCDTVLRRLGGEPAATGRAVDLGPARKKLHFVIVPGIFGECFIDATSPYRYGIEHTATYGYRSTVIRVSGRYSSTHNARQIADAVAEISATMTDPDEQIVLLG